MGMRGLGGCGEKFWGAFRITPQMIDATELKCSSWKKGITMLVPVRIFGK